jgi:hypothetical protein
MTATMRTELVAHLDLAGGGQVWVDGDRCYVGHMEAPYGTTILDVSDPAHPTVLAELPMPTGWHSHKVRAMGDVMAVNHEQVGDGPEGFRGGLALYDVSDPTAPVLTGKWETGGKGVHRFDFDGEHVYLSATVDGYRGNIVVILDVRDPAAPREVSRWWIPGQWTAGGEDYAWEDFVQPRCHHPLRTGDRLHVSYWHHGFYILDISDLEHPVLVGESRRSPAFPHPTHTCLVLPELIRRRRYMIVADEDVSKIHPSPPSFAMVYDITDQTLPVPVSTITIPGMDPDGEPQEPFTGCHQPSERFAGTVIPFAWFAHELQIFDVAEPLAPVLVGSYLPDPAPGETRVSSNDVTMDDRGLIYLVDRVRGLDIIRHVTD